MCTVTWTARSVLRPGEPWCLIGNRDERVERSRAEAPALRRCDGVEYIAPLDPESGGTWVWANAHGVVATVLNHYGAETLGAEAQSPRSRGLLMTDLAASESLVKLDRDLRKRLMEDAYAPFWLLGFQPGRHDDRGIRWSWNGRDLVEETVHAADLPVTTSSWQTDEVLRHRRELLLGIAGEGVVGRGDLLGFHQAESDRGPEWGALMTRHDARTVSLTEVGVTESTVEMIYQERGGDGELARRQRIRMRRMGKESQ